MADAEESSMEGAPPMTVQANECLGLLANAHGAAKASLHHGSGGVAKQDLSTEVGAPGEARGALLMEKRSLGSTMEELRAVMRGVQERCEWCTVESRSITALEASTRAHTVSAQDELAKVHGQLRRATQQAADHIEARRRLSQELSECNENFQSIIAQEVEAQAGMKHEVAQLQQVVRDLEGRIRSKSGEIDRLVRANEKVLEEATTQVDNWRQECNNCLTTLEEGPLGTCMEFLGRLARDCPTEARPRPREAQDGKAVLQEGELATPVGQANPELSDLRCSLGRREEQLVALQRKIQFLSEQAAAKGLPSRGVSPSWPAGDPCGPEDGMQG